MAAKILAQFKQQINNLKLVPAGGGCFELSANGEMIYSKLQSGEFPDEEWVIKDLQGRLK